MNDMPDLGPGVTVHDTDQPNPNPNPAAYAAHIASELTRRLAVHGVPRVESLELELEMIRSTDPDIHVPGALHITVGANSPLGWHRISYLGSDGWTYQDEYRAEPVPLPDAPTAEVLDAAAEWIVWTWRRRTVGQPAGRLSPADATMPA